MNTKICNKCHIEKPFDSFSKSSLKYGNGYQYTCKECCKKWRKDYYRGKKLEIERRRNREKQRKYRSSPEYLKKDRDRARASYQKNPDKHRARKRNEYAANPEREKFRSALKQSRRRCKLRNSGIESVDIKNIIARDGLRCHICKKMIERNKITIDHLIPVSKNGPHAEWNLGIAHKSCNSSRGNRGIAQLRLPLKMSKILRAR